MCIFSGGWFLNTSWYVSDLGTSQTTCGTSSHPCKNLMFVITRAAHGDIIFINSSCTKSCIQSDVTINKNESDLHINKSITISGKGSHSVIRSEKERKIRLQSSKQSPITVTFRDIYLLNFVIIFRDTNLVIENSKLVNVSAGALPPELCHHANLSINKVNWTSEAECDIQEKVDCDNIIININCQNMYMNITNSEIYDSTIVAQGTNNVEVRVDSVISGKKLEKETGIGGINIRPPHTSGYVKISNCVFTNHIHYEPILSAVSLEEAALRIDVVSWKNMTSVSHITVSLLNSRLVGNERAFSVTGYVASLLIKNCTFKNNVAMLSGPAIRVATSESSVVHIEDSIFVNNGAGQETLSAGKPSRGYFKIDRDSGQVHISSKHINGVQDMVGKGGAIRVNIGHVVIKNSTFINNTAGQLGGAIYVHANSSANIENCYFENSDRDFHPIQGDVIYSTGNVEMNGVTVKVVTAKDYIAILRHSGGPWSMYVSSLWFECPQGMNLMMVNNSAFQIVPEQGLMRSHRLDHMAYFCKTCGNHFYSLEWGRLNFTLIDNSTDYFTLRVDTKEPFQNHSAIYQLENIHCEKCPYGGACDADTGLSSLPNFWGYKYHKKVIFQRCPSGYCCSEAHCKDIDTCADRRGGVLCGRCSQNYSSALFSSNCVPNKMCKDNWFVSIAVATGIVYFLFLVLQHDIRRCLFEHGGICADCSDIKHRRISVRHLVRKSSEEQSELRSLRDSTPENISGTVWRERQVPAQNTETNKTSTDEETGNASSSGFLIILFYYFQDALLLHVQTVYTRSETKLQRQLKALLLSLFRFRLDVSQFLNDICVLPDMQPVATLILKTIFVPYVLLLFALTYLCLNIYHKLSGRNKHFTRANAQQNKFYNNVSTRLASGFILAMMFTYQKMATATFALLNCVPVANRTVLFIDGSISCFQSWQYAVMVYAFTCVVPFSLVLMVGPALMQRSNIGVKSFFFGCLLPLPALLLWIPKWVSTCLKALRRKDIDEDEERHYIRLTKEANTVIDILQGPFREIEDTRQLGSLCWSGILIGRRLILFLCFTFINDVLIRLLCMCCVCFVILLHHLYVQPYKSSLGNLSGALSAAALIVVGGINLVRAGFEAAEYIPQGPYSSLMYIFEDIENSFVLWVPLGGVCLISLILLVRLFMLVLTRIAIWCNDTKSNSNHLACNGQVSL